MISVRIVTVPATIRLFSRPRWNPVPGLNTSVKLANEMGDGMIELSNWSVGRRSDDTTIQKNGTRQ